MGQLRRHFALLALASILIGAAFSYEDVAEEEFDVDSALIDYGKKFSFIFSMSNFVIYLKYACI